MALNLAALDIDAALGVDDFLGRRRRRSAGSYRLPQRGGGSLAPVGPRQAAAMSRANRVASLAYPDVPGVPARDAALLPAGFPPMVFALATGLNPIVVQTNVQVPFRAQRLSTTVIRSGATALVSAPLLVQLQVGMKPINTTPSPVALETFAANAFDTNMLFPPTIPGTIYTLTVQLSAALTTTDTILVLVSMLGTAVL